MIGALVGVGLVLVGSLVFPGRGAEEKRAIVALALVFIGAQLIALWLSLNLVMP